MRKFVPKYLILLLSVLLTQTGWTQVPAFPGAEGFGMYTTGGRGGRVIKVTNLNDSGEGSLRAAVEATGPRIVVFEVSGIVELESDLMVYEPYLTIAGQTAPGDGICIKNYPLRFKDTHDIIVRFLRLRPGIKSGQAIDALELRRCKNVIVDHVSASWSVDEIVNTSHSCEDITLQWCLFSESLNNSIHEKGEHGYAASIGSVRTSYHKNLLANNKGRNPSITGDDENRTFDMNFSNNVIYNYQSRAMDGKPHGINVLCNYYKYGPSTDNLLKEKVIRIDNAFNKYGYYTQWYIKGNYLYGNPEAANDNWGSIVRYESGVSIAESKVDTPFADAGYTLLEPESIFEVVLDYAGACFPVRDTVDCRAVSDTRTGIASVVNGIIDRVEQVGGWPQYNTYGFLSDSDNDGMPDNWESENGLNANDSTDAVLHTLNDDYTNIEVYINGLVEEITEGQKSEDVVSVFEIKENPKSITLFFNNETKTLSVKHSEEVLRVEIYSITGAKLFSGEYNQKHLSIPLHLNSNGVHFIRVLDDKNEIETHKLFIK